MTHTLEDVQESATEPKNEDKFFKITATKHHRRAPKKIKGVLTGNWKPTEVSKSELIAFLTEYTFHKIIGEPTKEAIDKAKNKAPAFCMAAFKNNIRKKDHVEQVFGWTFDYDDGTTIADFEAATKDSGLFYVLYETFTSSPEKEKFRAVFPFSDTVPFASIQDWQSAHNGFAVELGLPLTFDPTCWQPERLFFLPSRPLGEDAGQTHGQDGACVDALSIEPVAVVRKDSNGKIIDAAVLEPLMLTVDGKEIDFRLHWNSVQHDIQLATILEEHQPDMIYSSRQFGGSHIQCPHDEEHGNSGKEDTATFVDNPNDGKPSTIGCLHGSCEHRETADHVYKLITDGKIEFSAIDPAAQVSDFIAKLKEGVAETLNEDGTEKKPPVQFYTKVYSAMTLAKALNSDSTDTALGNVLKKLAAEKLTQTQSVEVLNVIKSRTGKTIRDLKTDLKDLQQKHKVHRAQSRNIPTVAEATAAIVYEFNRQFASVKYGNKACILDEKGIDYGFMSKTSFIDYYGCDFVEAVTSSGDPIRLDKPLTWLGVHRRCRRRYDKVIFAPLAPNEDSPFPELHFNMWRGFAVDPVKGDWSLLENHLRDNVCQGNEERFKWVMSWFAQMVQQPRVKPESSITLYGKKGTGKSKVANWLRKMCGRHAFLISSTKHISGNFNAHLADCLFLQNEEATWAGNVAEEGTIKNLITSDTIAVEKKGIDTENIDNFTRVFTTTNNEWAVAATSDERRHMVLECGEEQMQNGDYFAAIDDQMNEGGLEAMLFDLLHFPYQEVDLRNPPRTEALARQVVQGFSSHERWLHDVLINGTMGMYDGAIDFMGERTPLHTDKPTLIEKEKVYHAYHEFCIRHKLRHEQNNVLMRNLGKYQVGSSTTGRGKNLKRLKVFPALPDMRKTFTGITNVKFEDEELV